MKEVNLLMDEMVEFNNDSEETGAAIFAKASFLNYPVRMGLKLSFLY
jgi:hypothetical protein